MSVARSIGKKKKEAAEAVRTVQAGPERYIRILELPRAPGDQYQGYQPEIVYVENDRIVRRELVSKPNLFEYAFTQAGELIDPRNEARKG